MPKPATPTLTIAPTVRQRKKNPPKTAFKKGGPNPHAFQKGVSGNPGGKSRSHEDRLVTNALRVRAAFRAPDRIAKALGLPRGASWAQCLAQSLLQRAISGDNEASRLVLERVDGPAKQSLELSGADGEPLFQPGSESCPLITVNFTSTEFQKERDAARQATIDALPEPHTTIEAISAPSPVREGDDPELAAARAEAALAAQRKAAEPADSKEPAATRTPVWPEVGSNPPFEHPSQAAARRFHRR